MPVKDFKALGCGTTGETQKKAGFEGKKDVKPVAPMRRKKKIVKHLERFFEGESQSLEKVVVRFRKDRPGKDLISMTVESKQVCSVPISLFGSMEDAAAFLTKIAKEYVEDRVSKKELYMPRDTKLCELSLVPPRLRSRPSGRMRRSSRIQRSTRTRMSSWRAGVSFSDEAREPVIW